MVALCVSGAELSFSTVTVLINFVMLSESVFAVASSVTRAHINHTCVHSVLVKNYDINFPSCLSIHVCGNVTIKCKLTQFNDYFCKRFPL